MDNKNNSKLQMLDFFFSKINFSQNKEGTGEMQLNIKYHIDYLTNNDANQVIIITNITDDNKRFMLEVVANGIFKMEDSDEISEDTKKNILKINTVAIMFPYIRSQISIITAQPGLTPIQLPIIDVNKLINNNN